MLQDVINLCISGERPTRAGLHTRAEASIGSAAGNRPWGGTRAVSVRSSCGVVRWRRAL
jgi:hypothetical protein